jgi:hypothetical protein
MWIIASLTHFRPIRLYCRWLLIGAITFFGPRTITTIVAEHNERSSPTRNVLIRSVHTISRLPGIAPSLELCNIMGSGFTPFLRTTKSKAPSSIDDRVLPLSTIISTSSFTFSQTTGLDPSSSRFILIRHFFRQSERFAGQLYLGRKRGKFGLIHVLCIDRFALPRKQFQALCISTHDIHLCRFIHVQIYIEQRAKQKSRQKSR